MIESKEKEPARSRTAVAPAVPVASEARRAEILDSSHDAVISIDGQRRIIVFNRGAEMMFGFTAEEILGRPLDLLIPSELAAAHRAHLDQFERSKCSGRDMGERGEIMGRRKNGETFPAQATISRLDHEGECILTAIVRDLTERRKVEEQIFHAQKIEAIGRLAGGIAHDFNNLLSGILGFATLLHKQLDDSDPRQRLVDEILYCGRRSATLTSQLLLFSRQNTARPQVLDVNAVVRSMESMLRRLISEEIEFTLALAPDLGHVSADPGQLEQVLMNLLLNARDAMPGGGRITLETRNEEVNEKRDVEGPHPGAYVVIEVSDTGCGMDEETRQHIFEPFFTTKRAGKGTGLGLAMVRTILEAANGHVEVASAPRHGSSFVLRLPRIDGQPRCSHGEEATVLLNRFPRAPRARR